MRLVSATRNFLSNSVSFNSKSKSNNKLFRQISCLALIYCFVMTFCVVPGTKWIALASESKSPVQSQQPLPNAAPPEVTNLPKIDETRYSKSDIPTRLNAEAITIADNPSTASDIINKGAGKTVSANSTGITPMSSLSNAISTLLTEKIGFALSNAFTPVTKVSTLNSRAMRPQPAPLMPPPSGY